MLTASDEVKSTLVVYKAGADEDPNDPLMLSGHVLLGARVEGENAAIGREFMRWVCREDGGQAILRNMRQAGERLYSEIPEYC